MRNDKNEFFKLNYFFKNNLSMMTFIVVGDFVLNAQFIDDQRLGKQRVEALQILDVIQKGTISTNGKKPAWVNHPIVKAWALYVNALKYYTNCIILEWIKRGKNNNLPLFELPSDIIIPLWAKWDRLHNSHRAMLIRKNPFHYKNKFSVEPEYHECGYIWPHSISEEQKMSPLVEITAPIPKELINPIYCQGILKSGKHSGTLCSRLVKTKTAPNNPYCKTHDIVSKLPKTIAIPIYCQGILKSGKRSGMICSRLVKTKTSSNNSYCKIHNKILL